VPKYVFPGMGHFVDVVNAESATPLPREKVKVVKALPLFSRLQGALSDAAHNPTLPGHVGGRLSEAEALLDQLALGLESAARAYNVTCDALGVERDHEARNFRRPPVPIQLPVPALPANPPLPVQDAPPAPPAPEAAP
jgi:hypothetical protein